MKKGDYRLLAFAVVLAVIGGLGYLVKQVPGRGVDVSITPEQSAFEGLQDGILKPPKQIDERPVETAADAQGGELGSALKRAVAQIGDGKHDDAIRTLNNVRPLAGDSAQAYHLLGLALLGKREYATARDFLARAIDLDPTLALAYFDHASASEGLGDLESALGGMRSYLHLEKDNDPYRLKIAQARSAIWEWEAKLGRGPWGPTKGIPPGFTADEIKRDGKGTGIKMQKPETLRSDGTMEYEIKSGERFPELWKE